MSDFVVNGFFAWKDNKKLHGLIESGNSFRNDPAAARVVIDFVGHIESKEWRV